MNTTLVSAAIATLLISSLSSAQSTEEPPRLGPLLNAFALSDADVVLTHIGFGDPGPAEHNLHLCKVVLESGECFTITNDGLYGAFGNYATREDFPNVSLPERMRLIDIDGEPYAYDGEKYDPSELQDVLSRSTISSAFVDYINAIALLPTAPDYVVDLCEDRVSIIVYSPCVRHEGDFILLDDMTEFLHFLAAVAPSYPTPFELLNVSKGLRFRSDNFDYIGEIRGASPALVNPYVRVEQGGIQYALDSYVFPLHYDDPMRAEPPYAISVRSNVVNLDLTELDADPQSLPGRNRAGYFHSRATISKETMMALSADNLMLRARLRTSHENVDDTQQWDPRWLDFDDAYRVAEAIRPYLR